jgi:hypothetical protein
MALAVVTHMLLSWVGCTHRLHFSLADIPHSWHLQHPEVPITALGFTFIALHTALSQRLPVGIGIQTLLYFVWHPRPFFEIRMAEASVNM